MIGSYIRVNQARQSPKMMMMMMMMMNECTLTWR